MNKITTMTKSLEYYMNSVPDHRNPQGTMYPIGALLTMMVLANMSGCYGYREMAGYMKDNVKDFKRIFNLKHGVPKHVSLRTFIMKLNYNALVSAFRLWCAQFITLELGDRYSVDGKGLNSTVENCHDSQQNYKSMVSLFCEKTGLVRDVEMIELKKSNEIGAVQQMLNRLEDKGIIITADALHCQKKRSAQL